MTEPTALIMGQSYTKAEFLGLIAERDTTVAREVTEIELAGVTYRFRKPKTALLMAGLMQAKGKPQIEQQQIIAEMQLKWIKQGVGKDSWALIEARLMEEEDDLDWDDLNEVFNTKLSEVRPTTSSSGSSAEPSKTTSSEDEQKPAGSIFGI